MARSTARANPGEGPSPRCRAFPHRSQNVAWGSFFRPHLEHVGLVAGSDGEAPFVLRALAASCSNRARSNSRLVEGRDAPMTAS